MSKETTTLAYRIPTKLKYVAKCLAEGPTLYELTANPNNGTEERRSVCSSSIHDVLTWLIRHGLSHASICVEQALFKANRELETWIEIHQFFVANPAVDAADRQAFKSSSAAVRQFDELDEIYRDNLEYAARWESEADPRQETVSRRRAENEYAHAHKAVRQLAASAHSIQALIDAEKSKLAEFWKRDHEHSLEVENRRLEHVETNRLKRERAAQRGGLRVVQGSVA